jgi:uncharacterized LabA/DUF88 family protein
LVAPTPKFRSAEFRDALSALKGIFDAHSLSVVLVDALERRAAEQVYGRFARGQAGRRIESITKAELVGQLTTGFFASEDVAYHLVREMDRACHKERHIVASIPAEQAPARVGSYRAIALKRERAKLVWALARDERGPVRELANRVIAEFFSEAADLETTKAVLEGNEEAKALEGVDLAKRLADQAERLQEAAQRVTDLEFQVGKQEAERARLLAQIGAKERHLKEQTSAREELEQQLDGLRVALSRVESEQAALDAAQKNEDRAKARAEDLALKVRRLSKLAGVSDRLTDALARIETLEKERDELARQVAKAGADAEAAQAGWAEERERLQALTQELREDLKRARRQLAEAEKRPVARGDALPEGVVLLLDQANLAASAHAVYGRKVNFQSLLDALGAGRKVRRAVAFVVDNGGAQFDAFCDTLRRAGWDLRVKKPKVFKNGRTKADWDMGIAVEAVEQSERTETMVLVSGDGDFAPLVRLLKRRGLRVEVAAFPEALAMELAEAADVVTRLDAGTLE